MRKEFDIVILVIAMALITVPFFFTIDDVGVMCVGYKWPIHCMLHTLTGKKCALCGMTRSFTAFSHGQLIESFAYHRIGPFLYIFLASQAIYRLFRLFGKKQRRAKKKTLLSKCNFYITIILVLAILINWMIYIGGEVWQTLSMI